MDKKRTLKIDEESFEESPAKKQKKHKKQKHKKKIRETASRDLDYSNKEASDAKPIKLKIKFGTFPNTEKELNIEGNSPNQKGKDGRPKRDRSSDMSKTWKAKEDVFRTKRSDEDTSDEEKQWLDALEKGTLDDKGEVKRSKDPTLMTARQRALIHGIKEEPLMELPSGQRPMELSEEQRVKRQQKAKHRRETAAKKQEKEKKQTLARLLTKQDSKAKHLPQKGKSSGSKKRPCVRYIQSQASCSISIPEGQEFPLSPRATLDPPKAKHCGVEGCSNLRKYTCSKTGVALCSLDCYKRNIVSCGIEDKRGT